MSESVLEWHKNNNIDLQELNNLRKEIFDLRENMKSLCEDILQIMLTTKCYLEDLRDDPTNININIQKIETYLDNNAININQQKYINNI